MNEFKGKWWIKILGYMCIGLVLFACIYSFLSDWRGFFSISFSQLLTLLVAVGITFYATQCKNDQRKAKEQIEKIVDKIENIVTDESFYKFSIETDNRMVTMTNRKLNNCILLLESYAMNYGVDDEIKYIRHAFDDYRDTVSDKINDLSFLSGSENLLCKYATNIETKCDQIMAKLYK